MKLFDILVLLILAFTGSGGQEIQFEVPQHSSSCQNGFRGTIDKYNIIGTIGPNYTALVESGWGTLVAFQVVPFGSTLPAKICYVSVGKGASDCNRTDPCYCDYFDVTTSLAHFIINTTSLASHSHGTLLMEWQHRNSTRFHGYGDKALPGIYDVNAADLTLYLNGDEASKTSESCGRGVRVNSVNTVKLCCSKAALPCYVRIALNGIIVAKNQSPCVNYTFTVNKTMNVTKSYSVCSLTDYIPGGSCLIEISIPTTTVATTSSSTTRRDSTPVAPTVAPTSSLTTVSVQTSSPTTVRARKDGNIIHGLMLAFILGFGIPIIVALCFIICYCLEYLKKESDTIDSNVHTNKEDMIGSFPSQNKSIKSPDRTFTILNDIDGKQKGRINNQDQQNKEDETTKNDKITQGSSVDQDKLQVPS